MNVGYVCMDNTFCIFHPWSCFITSLCLLRLLPYIIRACAGVLENCKALVELWEDCRFRKVRHPLMQ